MEAMLAGSPRGGRGVLLLFTLANPSKDRERNARGLLPRSPGCGQGEEAQVVQVDVNEPGGFFPSRIGMRPPHSELRWASAQKSPREHFHELRQALTRAPLRVSVLVAHR